MITKHRSRQVKPGRSGLRSILSLMLTVILSASVLISAVPFEAQAAGGAYTLKWYAADPAINKAPYLPTYAKLTPSQLACPGTAGRYADPLKNAVAYASPMSSSNLDAVTSLAPKDMALGQVVPFEMEIKVSGITAPENGVISFTTNFLTKTTSGNDFGYDPTYMVYCAFVDTADPGTKDSGNNAKVDSFTSTVANPGTSNEAIQGTFNVSGLDNGDNVIVEIWVVLKDRIPAGATGNVQTGLLSAKTASGDTISTGQQTVPLLRVKEFFTNNADVSVTKTDSPDPVNGTSPVTQEVVYLNYTLLVENHSPDTVANGINVTDTLDPNTTFVSASGIPESNIFYDSGSHNITFNVGALSPGQNVTLFVNTTVSDTAPTQNDNSTNPEPGSVTLPAIYDLLNRVTETAITSDSNTTNNNYYQPTNVLPGIQPSSTLTLLKQISNSSAGPWSDSITVPSGSDVYYNFTITNTGNVPLSSLSINDSLVDTSGITPPLPSTLAAGASYSGIVNVTAATLAGTYPNTATANGTYAGETKTSDPSSAKYIVAAAPALTIVKTATPTTYSAVGDVITYNYNVTNTGNVVVTDLNVSDNKTTVTLDKTTLQPGESTNGTATHTITQADIDAGSVTNSAYAAGKYDDNKDVQSEPDTETVTANQNPALTITKEATPTTYSKVGDVITYTYNVTNSGNVVVTNLAVTDNKTTVTLDKTTLQPGESTNGTASYTITQDDIEKGSVTNSAYAAGKYDDNQDVQSEPATATVTGEWKPALTITKEAAPTTYSAVGDVITYTYKVTNTGNVAVTGLTVTDNKTTVTLDKTTLQPGESANGTATYTITQDDIDAKSVTNSAYAAGKYDDNKDVQSEPATATVTAKILAPTGQITPTGTTCQQYSSGTAEDLTQANYLIDNKTSSIKSVAPGVMFYYSTIIVPEGGTTTISVDQSKDNSSWPFIKIQDTKQVILYGSGCTKIQGTSATESTDGKVTLTANNLPAGTYVLGIKYSLSSLQGFNPVTAPYPTVKYSFRTSLNGVPIGTSKDSIDLVSK